MKLFLATIESQYEISASATTKHKAVHLCKQTYKKFYGQAFPYPDSDIRVRVLEINMAYVDDEPCRDQKY